MAMPDLNVRLTAEDRELRDALRRARAQVQDLEGRMRGAGSSARGFAGGLNAVTNMSRQSRARVQQLGFQFQDIAVQLAAGTRASTVFAQQGSQILGIWGPAGAMLGAAAAVTIPLLATALSSATGRADAFAKALEEVRDRTSEANESYRAFALGIGSTEELRITDRITELKREQAEIEARIERLAGRNRGGAEQRLRFITAEIAKNEERLASLKQAEESEKAITDQVRETTEAERLLGQQMIETGRAASMLAYETERARDAAMEAAREWTTVQALRSRFAGEEAVMSQPVITPGPGQPPANVSGTSGGRGGGGRISTLGGDLESVREALMSREEIQIASFQRQQETLRTALEQKLLTQQEYQRLMEESARAHADRLNAIDAYKYGDGLTQAGAFFGDMATALQGGNEQMLRISKKFAAAEALVSTFQGAARALTLPFPKNLTAYAQVLAQGMSAVKSIRGVSANGGGAGGAGATGAAQAAPARPLEATLNLVGPNAQLFAGAIGPLFDALREEAGDRGYLLAVKPSG